MAEKIENVAVFTVDAAPAVRSIGELRENIKLYKQALNDAEIGSEQYNKILKDLQVNQTALKNAMHATTSEEDAQAISMEQVAKAAQGLGTSYNALVKRMADLTQEYRATEDIARRNDLAKQIRDINDELKKLDAERGIYGRQVGDYFNQITGPVSELIDQIPGLKNLNSTIKNTGQALQVMSNNPVLGIAQLLAPLIANIAAGLQDNETALGAIDKISNALKPVAEFFSGILEKLAGVFAKVVDFALQLGERTGISFKQIVSGAVGVGNVLLQYILTPFRTIINAAKGFGKIFKDIFTGNFKNIAADAKEAAQGIGDAFKQGFSFKANFKAGQQAGEEFAAGLKSPKAKGTAGQAGKELAEAALKGADEILRGIDDRIDKSLRERVEAERKAAKEEAELAGIMSDMWTETTDAIQEDLDAQTEAFIDSVAAQLAAEQDALEKEKQLKEQRLQTFLSYTSGVASLAGSLASIYEANGEADEEAARKAKALRTAEAIISTLGGAVSAYMNTIESIKFPAVAIPLAIVNAATVLAAGYAQVRQMNAVPVGGSGGSGAMVSAPAAPVTAIQQVRTITGASEEDRLNRMASDTRVYVLESDITRAQNTRKVRVAEATF